MSGDQEYRAVAMNREAAHEAITRGYAHAKCLLANGDNVLVVVKPALEAVRVAQRNFLHGVVEVQIAEQVRMPDGTRYVKDAWHEYYRKKFLPDTWEMQRLPGHKRKVPVRVRHSTEELGVKGYSEHIDRVIADAATEWGVQFVFREDEREAVRYVKPARKTATKAAQAAETEGA